MTECMDSKLLEHYLKKYKIREIFDTKDLPFRLYRYETGEMMNIAHSQEQYLKFLVDGRVAMYSINDNGDMQQLFEEKAPAFWGEVEICGRSFSHHYHEVIKTAYCIELPLEPLRDILWNDLRFMQYLVSRMSESIYLAAGMMEVMTENLETRLIHYLKHTCKNKTMSGMELTAKHLQCSRRQLQRVVAKLIEEEKIVKTGWGTYTLLS